MHSFHDHVCRYFGLLGPGQRRYVSYIAHVLRESTMVSSTLPSIQPLELRRVVVKSLGVCV